MAITRWSQRSDFPALRDMVDHIFENSFFFPRRYWVGESVRGLPIDMYETSDELVVKTRVPGVRPEDVDISVDLGMLTIKCHLPGVAEGESDGKNTWHYKELAYGEYVRSIALPAMVNPDKAEARFDNGELTLTIPKVEEAKPRKIKVISAKK